MHIKFIEVQNFRKLKSIRIDFSTQKTLFVGANNSGKTTAMVALRRFLIDQKHFNTHDFTLSTWKKINALGASWESEKFSVDFLTLSDWDGTLPSMDVWLHVEKNEIHYVQHLLPTLDWEGGNLGVRLRLEPKDLNQLYKEFLSVRQAAEATIAAAKSLKDDCDYTMPLWPSCMKEFLERGFNSKFIVRSYSLDPSKLIDPENGIARPQTLSVTSEFMEDNPFTGLIRIDEINAQRGFTDANNVRDISDGIDETSSRGDKRKLSEQLRAYYAKHLDPTEMPEPSDVDALEAIFQAQTVFDEKLKIGFNNAFKEVQGLGYPGISDPKLAILTKIKPMDGMNHPSALQYEIISYLEETTESPPRLPEQYNGLGYQNLISMIFRLMSFRDDWMQIGKAGKKAASKTSDFLYPPPLHLVLIEEPEAHLHIQVQQVFIRKAYDILRNNDDLKNNKNLVTQLVVSTHSSHLAHECDFSSLRYFRRCPATEIGAVPTSCVINLSTAFGDEDETQKFVKRYLRATHCDLFFADAAILVEGSAERMLVPHFIRDHFPELNQSYLSILEINGSHAHRLKPLIEHLGLNTLVITDIDSVDSTDKTSKKATRGLGQVTGNTTLKSWHPNKEKIDELLDVPPIEKVKKYDDFFSMCVAYQCPISIMLDPSIGNVEVTAGTFEDALAFENINIFENLNGNGLIKKFKASINSNKTPDALGQAFFDDIKSMGSKGKAEFALDLLFLQEPKSLAVPTYIHEGLTWIQDQLKRRQSELITVETI